MASTHGICNVLLAWQACCFVLVAEVSEEIAGLFVRSFTAARLHWPTLVLLPIRPHIDCKWVRF